MENNNQNNADEEVFDAENLEESPDNKGMADIPKIIPKNLDDLYATAKEYVEAAKLGVFQAYHWPFEIQIESDFRSLYKMLSPLFDAADKARLSMYKGALKMRIYTYIGLFPFLAAFGFALDSVAPDNQSTRIDISGLSSTAGIVSIIVMMSVAFSVFLIRIGQIASLREQASDFGSAFNKNLEYLHAKASKALKAVKKDRAQEVGCDIRAEQWSFVAMWLFQLHQYYDRYVTTQSWRAQTRLQIITWVFRGAKVVTPFVFFGFLYGLTDWFLTNLLLTLIAVVGALGLPYLVWDLFGKSGENNNLWAKHFVKGIAGDSEEEQMENHMNTQVANLIRGIRADQFQIANAH